MSIGLTMLSIATAAPTFSEDAVKDNILGNRCGHNPAIPRYFEPSKAHKSRPSVIQYAINNLQHFYKNPSKWLYSLESIRVSKRQERSESREADAAILGVLLHYTELASLRVGFHDETGSFISLDMRFIARKVGWRTAEDDKQDKALVEKGLKPKDKGIKRVWRAITRFKRAGYLTVHRRFNVKKTEVQETVYKGIAAIRTVNQRLFKDLGITLLSLERKRKEASKRLKEKQRKYLQKAEAIVASLKKGVGKQLNPLKSVAASIYKTVSSNHQIYEYKEKERQAKCFELLQLPENKGMTSEEFYEKFPHLRKRE